MKLKATFIAAIMAVSMSSHAQEGAAVGVRLGAQSFPDVCKLYPTSCKDTVPVVNPYVRLYIYGPHNLELAGKFALADYKGYTRRALRTYSGVLYFEDQWVQVDSKSLLLSYEHRPLGGDVAFRVGWHYTEIGEEGRQKRSATEYVYSDEEKINGFVVGAGFDLFRGINLAVDWSDWDGRETLSMMLGYEI